MVKTFSIVIWSIVAIYLIFCMTIITDTKVLKALQYLIQIIFFISCIKIINHHNNKFILVYFLFFSFYFILGLLYGNARSFLVADIFSFTILIAVFLFVNENRNEFTEKIINKLSLFLLFGAICALYFFNKYGLQPASSLDLRLSLEGDALSGNGFKYSFALLQVSVILLPFFWYLDSKKRVILIITFLIYFGASAFILARANLAVSVVAIFFLMYIGLEQKFIRPNVSTIALFTCIFLGIFSIFIYYGGIIEILYSLITSRFNELGSGEMEPRDLEAFEYFSRISTYEMWFGKGMGGVNNYPFGRYYERGIMMLHRGENNLILKGGIIFLILLYGTSIIALFKLIVSKAIYSSSWAAVIIMYFLFERGHQQYSQFFMLLFFCFAISYGLNVKLRKNSSS